MSTKSINRFPFNFDLGLSAPVDLRESMARLMVARLGVLYSVLSVIVLYQIFSGTSGTFSLGLSYCLLASSFAFNLFHSIWLERIRVRSWLVVTHVIFDASITSTWIYFSDGRDSVYALLFLLQILIVALIFYQRMALFASLVSSATFGLVTFLNNDMPNAFLNWVVYTALFVVLGLVGGYLSEELYRASQKLNEKQAMIEKLRAFHERILSDMPTGCLSVDQEMRINFINQAGAHILGRTDAGVVGKPLVAVESGLVPFFSNIHKTDTAPSTLGEDTEISASEDTHHRTFFVKAKSDRGDVKLQQTVEINSGEHTKVIRGDVAMLEPEEGKGTLLGEQATGGLVLLFQDVTKLFHLEERLKQNEKLAAVGQLAAGIAHEIRNPLASMSGSIEMLKNSAPEKGLGKEDQKLMDIAIREIDRLNRLVTEFLGYVKPGKLALTPVEISEVLAELVLSAKRSNDFYPGLAIDEKYASPVRALANEEKLKQVMWNLLVNAIQAMPSKGSIEVGCNVAEEGKVKFWVKDHGCGMSEEVLAHLYEPFFTTKSKGTGLGLATVYKIVEAHQGEILVHSEQGKGTTFEVFLKAAT